MSTIFKKFLVAITGLFFITFLLVHLAGNLQIFNGQEAINSYGVWLRTFPVTLWILRILLIASLLAHVFFTIDLTRLNKKARSHNYANSKPFGASISSRTMMISGLTVLSFAVYHLAHFTLGLVNSDFMELVDINGRHDVYKMMILGFQNPIVSFFYIIAQVLLAFHLSHGISSSVRTLGIASETIFLNIKKFGQVFAIIIACLYCSIPLSILFGFIHL